MMTSDDHIMNSINTLLKKIQINISETNKKRTKKIIISIINKYVTFFKTHHTTSSFIASYNLMNSLDNVRNFILDKLITDDTMYKEYFGKKANKKSVNVLKNNSNIFLFNPEMILKYFNDMNYWTVCDIAMFMELLEYYLVFILMDIHEGENANNIDRVFCF